MKILAIGAHPDDIEFYAFGSLLAWKDMGARLALAVATDGAAAGGALEPAELKRLRRVEAETSAAMLGASPVFLDFPDGQLLPDRALHDALKALISRGSLWGYFKKGGPIMWPLLFVSLLSFSVIIERLIFLAVERRRFGHERLRRGVPLAGDITLGHWLFHDRPHRLTCGAIERNDRSLDTDE